MLFAAQLADEDDVYDDVDEATYQVCFAVKHSTVLHARPTCSHSDA